MHVKKAASAIEVSLSFILTSPSQIFCALFLFSTCCVIQIRGNPKMRDLMKRDTHRAWGQ